MEVSEHGGALAAGAADAASVAARGSGAASRDYGDIAPSDTQSIERHEKAPGTPEWQQQQYQWHAGVGEQPPVAPVLFPTAQENGTATQLRSTTPAAPAHKTLLPKTAAAPATTTGNNPAAGDNGAEVLERRKNEIVQEMLQRIRPFMGPSGRLRADADFGSFSELMAGETQYVQRTLLLTIMLNLSAADPSTAAVYQAMVDSAKFMAALAVWWSECVKHDSPLLVKLLDLMSRLPLTVDQLVEHRLGKSVKRLAASEGAKGEIRAKAAEICEAWTKMARQEDARRRHSLDAPAGENSSTSSAERRKSSAESAAKTLAMPVKPGSAAAATVVVANLSLFNEAPAAPPVRSRAAQVLERAARGETLPAKPTTRPLSADDIHKAKRRQQYLSEAALHPEEAAGEGSASGSGGVSSTATPNDLKVAAAAGEGPPRKSARRVSFANEPDLVRIHYFEAAEGDEYESEGHNYASFHEMDRNEASFAFKRRLALVMETECEWRRPARLESVVENVLAGSKSIEKDVQEQRERTALSALYFSPEDIPSSPSEAVLSEDGAPIPPKTIPLKDVDGRIVTVVRMVGAAPMSAPFSHKKGTPSPPPRAKTPPLPKPPAPLPVNPDLLNSLFQNPTALHEILRNLPPPNSGPRPPSLPLAFPPLGAPLGAKSIPMPFSFGVPPPRPPPENTSQRSLCKFYKKGQPESCRFGASCQFYHSDR